MKKKILLLQLRTDQSQEHEVGCILVSSGLKRSDLHIVNAISNPSNLPSPKELKNYRGIITGASGQFNISDWSDEVRIKVEKTYPIFQKIVEDDIPTLAICFGHQVLATLFGGKVEKAQGESGTVMLSQTEDGKKSKLFQGLPDSFYVVSAHKEAVTKLPKGARILASSPICTALVYQMKNNIFSTQYHPELNLDSLMWRLNLYPEYMQGKTQEEIRAQFEETPYASKIFENFLKIAQ